MVAGFLEHALFSWNISGVEVGNLDEACCLPLATCHSFFPLSQLWISYHLSITLCITLLWSPTLLSLVFIAWWLNGLLTIHAWWAIQMYYVQNWVPDFCPLPTSLLLLPQCNPSQLMELHLSVPQRRNPDSSHAPSANWIVLNLIHWNTTQHEQRISCDYNNRMSLRRIMVSERSQMQEFHLYEAGCSLIAA